MLSKPEYMPRMFQKDFSQQLELFIIIVLFKFLKKVLKIKVTT